MMITINSTRLDHWWTILLEENLLPKVGEYTRRLAASCILLRKVIQDLANTAANRFLKLHAVDATDARQVTEVPSL
jgi:hypothetical protein